jgi:hypothetical protein
MVRIESAGDRCACGEKENRMMHSRRTFRMMPGLLAALVIWSGGGPQAAGGEFAGRLSITLDKALYQKSRTDDKPVAEDAKPLQLDLSRENGRWSNVIGMAPNFNRGHHRGRVLASKVAADGMNLAIEMRIASDPWVKGGRAEYRIELKKADGGYKGTFRGEFEAAKVGGQAEAEAVRLARPPEGFTAFQPGEHPRMLFRKGDIARLKAKLSHPVCRRAYEKIKADVSNPVAVGVIYQFTGDRKHAEAAVDLVVTKMKDHTGGAFNLGHAWGPRVRDVALTYDLCQDAWSGEFRQEVRNYVTWVAERLILRPNSVSRKVNWNPNSNYHAFLRGGAAMGTLALVGDKGPRPDPPRDPGLRPMAMPAATVRLGEGAPKVGFEYRLMPTRWLFLGPIPDEKDADADFLAPLGGAAGLVPTPQTALEHGGKRIAFQPLDRKHFWGQKEWTDGRKSIDMTSVTGRLFDSTSYYFTVVDNDRQRLVEFRTGQSGACKVAVWINGRRVHDRDYLVLAEGRHTMMVRAHMYRTTPWGKIWMRPHFVETDEAEALADLKKRQVPYKLAVAEYREDLAARDEMGGANPRWIYNAALGKYHMSRYYRYCMGDGGYQVEGEGYTGYSSGLPLEYAGCYLRMYGTPVNPRPDVSHFAPRYVATGVFGGKRIHSQSFSLTNGTIGARHYARCFPLVPRKHQPAVLWAWHQTMGLTPDGEGKPNVGDTMDAVYTLLHYPVGMKACNPEKCMPKTWVARTKGCYVFRNGWKGPGRDIVAQAFLKAEGEGGWSHPDGGSIRIWGLGHAWAVQGEANPKGGIRWYENVVMLPDDPINTRTRAVETAYHAEDDGSGVVSMDMGLIYKGAGTDKDKQGNERRRPLVDNSFLLQPQNFMDLGIRGMRSFAVDFSGRSGSPALFALADRIKGGGGKVWMWQVPAWRHDSKDRAVRIEGGTFTIVQGDATLTATFISPKDVKLRHVTGKQEVALSGGKRGALGLNAIHAAVDDSAAEFFVVMTLQRGAAPKVASTGEGLRSVVSVGSRTIAFDGEKIVIK